ncbi:DUF3055 domain-containing protein [Shimazuella sp. AN120528]|uniref:SAV0927 family protein n=1 Tax=Shimazuella soli TaxID=1892854 RepID=UPI001F0E7A9D|nr:SAV0927 family protein [Shimazuella soli]MCH5585789.1 DUF3055 domain-containing protein [Shimazuella soli]
MEILSDETERLLVRHVCLITEEKRYDVSLIYSSLFYGKYIVTCFQTGKMVLLSADDIDHEEHWSSQLDVPLQDRTEMKQFLNQTLGMESRSFGEQI